MTCPSHRMFVDDADCHQDDTDSTAVSALTVGDSVFFTDLLRSNYSQTHIV